MKLKFLNLRNLIPVIITGLILSSCNKDSTPSNDLVGTWTMKTTTFSVMIGNKTFTQYLIDELGLTAAEAQTYNTLLITALQQTYTGTIIIKPDNTYTATMGGETDTGTWSLSSDSKKLTIDSSTDDPITFDVIDLTSSLLHLQAKESETDDLNGDDVPETLTITIDLTFSK